MRLRPMFAWYDLWVGVFWDRKKRRLYVFPLPCVGFYVEWPDEDRELANLTTRSTSKKEPRS